MAAAAPPSFPSVAWGRRAVTAASAGQGWAGPRTPVPLLHFRLPAPGLGHQGSCDPSVFPAVSWGCARTPAPGIMGNGMTKVGGRGSRSPHLPAPGPTAALALSACL